MSSLLSGGGESRDRRESIASRAMGRGLRMRFPVRRHLLWLCALGFVMLAGVLDATPAAFAAEGEVCSNEAVRAIQDASMLPDCRAWELVTPPPKDNIEARMRSEAVYATEGFMGSATGERMAWVAEETVPGSSETVGEETVGSEYLATRGAGGWRSEDVIPRQSPENGVLCQYISNEIGGYTADLSKAVFMDGAGQNYKSIGGASEEDCGHNEPALTPNEPEGFQNLFVRDNDLLSYLLVNLTPSGVSPTDAWFDAGSSDFSHVVFSEAAQLTPNAPAGNNLYESSNGEVRLVTVLPDGKSVHGVLPGDIEVEEKGFADSERTNPTQFTHTVSSNGLRVFFNAEGSLYVREDAAATVQLDKPQGGAGVGGGAKFLWATPDGSEVFFSDDASAGLTSDTVANSGQNLYEYELPTQDGVDGTLKDLTPVSDARVLGLTGMSEEGAEAGSYVYFAAEGPLASGATSGQPNLYLLHAGETTFISKLQPSAGIRYPEAGDSCDWLAACSTARVSPDGRYLAFTSIESLTGYDNTPAEPSLCSAFGQANGELCREVFLYDAAAKALSCVSCDPDGAAPMGMAVIRTPTPPSISTLEKVSHLARNVTNGGQVFFDTFDALVAQDSNGRRDVYEYDNGRVRLLSSGTQAGESFFVDASESGRDVFITSAQQLVRRDTDTAYDVYDVRAGGGFAEAGVQPECADEGCRGLASLPPVLSLPDSASLISSGNVSQSAGTTVRTVHPKKAKHHKKHHRRKRGHRRRRRAHHGSAAKRHPRTAVQRARHGSRSGK
jgi:WD40 repeat protein